MRAVGIKPGDQVVTVANAGMYRTTALRAIGAIPVYVDVSRRNLLISPEALSTILSPAISAVIVTHLYGNMAPMEEILALAGRCGVPVIEDCAQAHGARVGGRRAG